LFRFNSAMLRKQCNIQFRLFNIYFKNILYNDYVANCIYIITKAYFKKNECICLHNFSINKKAKTISVQVIN